VGGHYLNPLNDGFFRGGKSAPVSLDHDLEQKRRSGYAGQSGVRGLAVSLPKLDRWSPPASCVLLPAPGQTKGSARGRTEEISSRNMPDVDLRSLVYKDERPKEYFDTFHERTRGGPPGATYEVVRALTVLHALTTFRARGVDSGNVPAGPLILAPNHASNMDHFFTAAFIRRRIQFMAKSQLFGSGPLSWIYSHGGVFPVRRGDQDEEAFTTAFRILDRGGAMVMYCEGTRSRTGKLAASARPGVGRLALESGAPVVPVAILGSHQVRNWKRLQFPKVTVRYGAPFKFDVVSETTRDQRQEAADYIFARIKELHSDLERRGHRAARRGQRADTVSNPSGGPGSET
jgi:1-acyl-sn-glycerol-3-phosphate acyltransferase